MMGWSRFSALQKSVRHAGRLSGQRSAFTLIELLVVIGIIGALVALLLPAVLIARESARRLECQNHLKQQSLAVLQHVSQTGDFPSNGWGFAWVGEPDRDSGARQPGGWVYSTLPYLEQSQIHQIGRGLSGSARLDALSEAMRQEVPVFICPTRRGAGLLPADPDNVPRNARWSPLVAKTDYAICEGDYITDTQAGPASLKDGDFGTYSWAKTQSATGVSFQRSSIGPSEVRDGLSNTYLVGEKYVSRRGYRTFDDSGFDQAMCGGVDLDLNRWTIDPPLRDGKGQASRRFGGPHAVCNMSFCDGRVVGVSFTIAPDVHRCLGNRRDGQSVSLPE